MENTDRIEINLGNGYYLNAERNTEPGYENEIFIGITREENGKPLWWQDLACVRPTYTYANADGTLSDTPNWNKKLFDVIVWGHSDEEDWTNSFKIDLYEEEEPRTEFAI